MKTSHLKVIRNDYHDEADLCLTEMLTDWLKRMNPPPTWEALVDALKSQTVGYEQLADTIEKTHCKSKSNHTCNTPILQSDSKTVDFFLSFTDSLILGREKHQSCLYITKCMPVPQ